MSLKNVLAVALGIFSAIGGFVDIGDLVFNTQAGATFGFQLLWVVVIGVLGIIVYSEMCGRVSAVAKRPVFDLVRERTGFGAGLGTLIASEIVNLMTCAAEIGGVAICLQLLSGLPYRLLIPLGVVGLVVSAWALPFRWIERVFGYLGLCLLVFGVAAIKLHPEWSQVAHGFVPGSHSGGSLLVYLYFVVGLLGAAMTPYEVYFYSSGVVEDRWGPKDLSLNKVTAIIGYALGGFLSLALMIVAAVVFLPRGISPQFLGTPALAAEHVFGQVGLLLALVGILFAVGGAAIETSFAGAYNLAQFFGWNWGKKERPANASRFTLSWFAIFALALLVVMTGVDPVKLTEYSVIFSVVALPLTYLPILLVANDHAYMGAEVNGKLANFLGVLYFSLILVIAVAAIPLMLLTKGGQG
ncbi:MAG: Nramp family divalent metal transporter [Actinomycetota bacterium]|nr:Nramp family divalent metal transporter [Actinomycetota bacterium]